MHQVDDFFFEDDGSRTYLIRNEEGREVGHVYLTIHRIIDDEGEILVTRKWTVHLNHMPNRHGWSWYTFAEALAFVKKEMAI